MRGLGCKFLKVNIEASLWQVAISQHIDIYCCRQSDNLSTLQPPIPDNPTHPHARFSPSRIWNHLSVLGKFLASRRSLISGELNRERNRSVWYFLTSGWSRLRPIWVEESRVMVNWTYGDSEDEIWCEEERKSDRELLKGCGFPFGDPGIDSLWMNSGSVYVMTLVWYWFTCNFSDLYGVIWISNIVCTFSVHDKKEEVCDWILSWMDRWIVASSPHYCLSLMDLWVSI